MNERCILCRNVGIYWRGVGWVGCLRFANGKECKFEPFIPTHKEPLVLEHGKSFAFEVDVPDLNGEMPYLRKPKEGDYDG